MLTRIVSKLILPDMRNVGEIIDVLGGNSAVARDLGIKASAVSEMKRRGSVHPKYWPGLIRLADERSVTGVTAESLMKLHSRLEVAA